jgi:signal transduction histidine kinase
MDGRAFWVRAGRPIENLEEEIWDTTITVAGGLVFSGFLLMGISFLTAGFILKPIRRMNEQARDISEKHLERRLPLSAGRCDEFTALAQTLNVDLSEILKSLIADYRFMAAVRDISIRVILPERLEMEGDAEKLGRAFSNILDNAIKYAADGGQVEVAGEASGADLKITIGNDGPGVPESEIPKVFEQFYRVEQSRSMLYGGSGLGLAIVKRVMELHGGHVKFESQQKGWTRVTVSLPRHQQSQPA